jgi:hypothetical protein
MCDILPIEIWSKIFYFSIQNLDLCSIDSLALKFILALGRTIIPEIKYVKAQQQLLLLGDNRFYQKEVGSVDDLDPTNEFLLYLTAENLENIIFVTNKKIKIKGPVDYEYWYDYDIYLKYGIKIDSFKILCQLATVGNLEMISKWYNKGIFNRMNIIKIMHSAILGMQLKIIQFIHEKSLDKGLNIFDKQRLNICVAEVGSIEIIEWLWDNYGIDNKNEVIASACRYGQLDFIKWFWNKSKFLFNNIFIEWAAMNGHLEVIKWFKNKSDSNEFTIKMSSIGNSIDYAALNGHLDVIKWFFTKGILILITQLMLLIMLLLMVT